jgi:hypothetical protein
VVFVVLAMPFALLGVLFAMDVVEHWVVGEAPASVGQSDIRLLIPEQRQSPVTFDPPAMVSQGPMRQSLRPMGVTSVPD